MASSFDSVQSAQVLEQIQRGEKKAWDQVVDVFYQPLYAFILGMTRQPEIAEELVQDVFVNFWTKREQIQINTSLKAYLYRAARNHTLNFLKRQSFEANYRRELAQKPRPKLNITAQEVQYNELENRLKEAIQELEEPAKEIFELSRFENLTYKEISETLDIPVRQVHYQISLALKSLRKALRGYVNLTLLMFIVMLA